MADMAGVRASAPRVKISFTKGQTVRIIDGPFADFIDVYRAAKEAVGRARNGMGPALIEAVCYRHYGQ